MAMKRNIWRPDTCGCVIEYEWDSSVPGESRVHVPINMIQKCSYHTAISDVNSQFTTLIEESQRKNFFLRDIEADFSDLYDIVTSPDGSQYAVLKQGKIITWYYDESRILHVVLSEGFKNNDVTRFTNWLSGKGITNIVVELP